jgi:predicted methyltransferase
MRPGGLLVIVDFNRIEGKSRPWTMDHVRAGKEVFRKEIEEAGFKFEEELAVEIFKENYLLKFRK